jgi:uncharacterized YigZ family protein
MEKDYLIPAEKIRREIIVVNSRFISTLSPVSNVDEARTFIREVRAEFSDATHNVPAYLIGSGNRVIAHCADDGEPSGTAGRPVLSVLQGSGLGDVAVVVTRYFGGTKLGTGGLVRAYTNAVKMVVQSVPRARLEVLATYLLDVPYPMFNGVERMILENTGEIVDRVFEANVILTLRVKPEYSEMLQHKLADFSAGTLEMIFIDQKPFIRRL